MSKLSFHDGPKLQDIAHKLRVLTIHATQKADSGHPTTCSSLAEILSVLFFKVMRHYVSCPKHPANDRLVLSKGHAAPILYAAWVEAGLVSKAQIMGLRRIDSDFEGHPTPRLNFIDVGTGSLGIGLSMAAGMAYVGKYVDKAKYRVYCIIGDGESAEGSIWEACCFASRNKLDNLCIIMDANRLGQTGPTTIGHNLNVYVERFQSFGLYPSIVNGHDVEALVHAFSAAEGQDGKPTIIIAKTVKGKYFLEVEDKQDYHGKVLGKEAGAVIAHIEGFIKDKNAIMRPREPEEDLPEITCCKNRLSEPPNYKKDELVAVRFAYGNALVKLAKTNPRVLAFDADTSNSTYSEKMKFYKQENFVECYLAEQNMAGLAIGAACRNRAVPFVSTFSAFLTRCYDQIRMGAISQSVVNFCGSHCGVSIGPDGPSQMGLEDIAMFRAVPGCTIFYPSDAVSCERAVELAANIPAMTYIRATRAKTRIIYPNDETFDSGKAKVLRCNENDKALIITGGITTHEALEAYTQLSKECIYVRIIDLFTIHPIDKDSIICNAVETEGRIITVEDHYINGGLGDAVLSVVAQAKDITVLKMGVTHIPRSGNSSDVMDLMGISSKCIVRTVKSILSSHK